MQWYEWYIVMWKRGLDFTGRTSRHGYWYVVLMNVLIGIAINIVGAVARSGAAGLASDAVFDAISVLYSLAALVPGLALSVRRLHDTGRSAWNLLWNLIPVIGTFVLFVFFLLESDSQQPNRYGLTDAF